MLTYGKVKEQTVWTMIYRNLLDEMSSQLPEYTGSENLLQKIDELKSKKYIDQSSFRTVQLEYINFVQQRATAIVERKRKERIVKELSHSLINMGYNVNNSLQTDESFVRQILAGDKIYFDTKWDGYKIMVMLNPNGEIVTRLVKFVRDGKERTSRSSYTKQRDLQICHVWCSSYDQLVSHLKSCGFIVKENLRKSPDDEELVYIVDEKETKVKKSIKTEDRSLKLH
jgi:hypothetical protein